MPLADPDDRLAWRPSLIVEHRTGWGLLGALQLGAELRAADDAQARPLTAAIDLGLGGSITLVERWALALVASARTRLSLAPLAAGAAAVPWTASGGLTFGSPGEGFFRLGAGIDSPGLTTEIAKAGVVRIALGDLDARPRRFDRSPPRRRDPRRAAARGGDGVRCADGGDGPAGGDRVKPETALRYVREVPRKYLPGRFVSKVPSGGPLAGKQLDGKMILEVPVQTAPVPRAILQEASANQVTIRDVTGRVYQ